MNIYLAGIIGGLVGGVVFGAMMGKMGILPKIAKLWGGSSSGLGFFVHLVNSAIIGALYIFGVSVLGLTGVEVLGTGILYGLVYGAIWWILGGIIIMPVWLGMGFQLSGKAIKMKLPGLVGHLVYGLLLGLTVVYLL